MRIELYHASKYGNGARVAQELRRLLTAQGQEANVHHVSAVDPREVPAADLYVFGSPTHFGKVTGSMMKFLKKADLPPGGRYAVFATCSSARPDKRTGRMPSQEELERSRRTIPMMDEQLAARDLHKVAEMHFFVRPEEMKGPLEEGWEGRVQELAQQIQTALSER